MHMDFPDEPVFNPLHILSDIDGVVCNYLECVRRDLLTEFGMVVDLYKIAYPGYGDQLVQAAHAIDKRFETPTVRDAMREYLDRFFRLEDPYYQANPYWNALELYRKRWSGVWSGVYFITSRHPYLAEITLQWLKTFQFKVKKNRIFLKKSGDAFESSFKPAAELCDELEILSSEHILVIDDDASYLEHLINGRNNMTAWLLTREWNHDYPIRMTNTQHAKEQISRWNNNVLDRPTRRVILRGGVDELEAYLIYIDSRFHNRYNEQKQVSADGAEAKDLLR